MVKMPCDKILGKERERERERELEGEKDTGEEGEMRENKAGNPFYFFLTDLDTLEHRGPRSSVFRFQILPFAVLVARWSAGARTRAGC